MLTQLVVLDVLGCRHKPHAVPRAMGPPDREFLSSHHSPVVGLILGHCSSGRKSNAFFDPIPLAFSSISCFFPSIKLWACCKVFRSLTLAGYQVHGEWKVCNAHHAPGCGGCHVPASHTGCGPQNPGAAPSLPPCLMIVAKEDVCLLRYWNRWSLTAWGHWEAWRDSVRKVLSPFPRKPSGFYLSALFAFCFWEVREAVVGRSLATHCSSYLVWRQGS